MTCARILSHHTHTHCFQKSEKYILASSCKPCIPFLCPILLTVAIGAPAVSGVGMLGLPSAGAIESLVVEYQSTLSLRFRQERFFPSLRFPFNGRIIGWKMAAVLYSDRGRTQPILAPWSFDEEEYVRGEAVDILPCIASTIPLDNFTVFVHENGPEPPGVPFNEGDVLSLFVRPENNANFVPYLYNGNLQSTVNASSDGNFSYFRNVQVPRDSAADLNRLPNRDVLLPLLALELCES